MLPEHLHKSPSGKSSAPNLPLPCTPAEMLVIIAVITLFLTVPLTAFKRVQEPAKRVHCLFTARTLTLAWSRYVEDNHGRLPVSYTADNGWIRAVPGFPTNPHEAPAALQLAALEDGLLFPYLNTTQVFRCPAAPKHELRTYSMTHALNGHPATASYGGRVLRNFSEIDRPESRIVFLDDTPFNWDACWMVFNDRPQWWNTMTIRHGYGGNVFSFADGHAEYWSWSDRRTSNLFLLYDPSIAPFLPEAVQPDNPDLQRVQAAVWGKLGY